MFILKVMEMWNLGRFQCFCYNVTGCTDEHFVLFMVTILPQVAAGSGPGKTRVSQYCPPPSAGMAPRAPRMLGWRSTAEPHPALGQDSLLTDGTEGTLVCHRVC